MPRNKIPDGWGKYSSMGRQVPGTRFVPFKTPLKSELLNARDSSLDYFNTRSVMDHCSALGLVIDLTNVDRYYDPQDFIDAGISHEKLKTMGHAIPPRKLILEFAKIVENFLEKNEENDKVIGVHCTHGVNRTGYMICRYMIEQLGVPPDQALSDFQSARGYEIERKNYLDHLRKFSWGSNSSLNSQSLDANYSSQSFTDEEKEEANSSTGVNTPPYMPHRSRWGRSIQGSENPFRYPSNDRQRSRTRSHSRSLERNLARADWGSEPTTPEFPRGRKRSASTAPGEGGENESDRRALKSPRLGKKYYNQYYHGKVHHQYDTDFYRRGGGGIGPHRPPPRCLPPVQGDGKYPRQYRGPRPYRSPPREEESVLGQLQTPNQKSILSPEGSRITRSTSRNNLVGTPDLLDVGGPTRNPLSPGADMDVFSPENEFVRRRSNRYQPY